MERIPLTEDAILRVIEIKEENRPLTEAEISVGQGPAGVLMTVTGVLQNYLHENVNKRVYPKKLWESILAENSPFSERLKTRQVYGVLEHPGDSKTKTREISHVMTEARFATASEISNSRGALVEGDIIGSYDVVDTAAGRDLAALHRAKVGIGVSSRGDGCVRKEGTRSIVEDFDLDTWDVVASPSVRRARPNQVVENATLHESVGGNQEFQRIAIEARHAKKTGNEQALSAAKAKLQDWCLANNVDMQTDPEILGVLTECEQETPVPNKEKLQEGISPSLLYYRRRRGTKDQFHKDDKEVITEMVDFCKTSISLQEGITDYCKDYEKPFPEAILEAVKTASLDQPRKHTNAMNHLSTLKTLKSRAHRLMESSPKGLKFHAKAALLEEVSTIRQELSPLLEDKMCTLEVQNLNQKLVEFEETFEDPAPDAPGGDIPPGDTAPAATGAEDVSADDIEAPLPDTVVASLQDAADTIEELSGPEDEEATTLVAELRSFIDTDGEGAVEGEDFVDSIPPQLTESVRRAKLVLKESAASSLIVKSMGYSSRRLLESHHKLKAKLRTKMTESARGPGQPTYKEYKQAAEELAESYNLDMCKTTMKLIEATEKDLFEANKDTFKAAKTFKQLEESIAAARSKAPAKTTPPVGSKGRLTEDTNTDDKTGRSKLNESECHPTVSFLAKRRASR